MITNNDCRQGDNVQLLGLSTDIKPTSNIGENSLYLELDTGDVYYFSDNQWLVVGGN